MNSYFTLKNLTGPTERDFAATFRRMAEMLATAEPPALLQFRILDGERESYWHVVAGKGAAHVGAERADKPDLEIITTSDTWWEIARGALSPLRAFVGGRMRVRGNIDVGTGVLQHLAPHESLAEHTAGSSWQ